MTGKVVKVFGRYYTVLHSGKRTNCVLRGKIRNDKRLKQYSEPVVTGDIVKFEINNDGEGVINSIDERENVFSRMDSKSRKEDLIASNLDMIVVIQSFDLPKYNLRFVDRILIRGIKEGIPVLLCVNKSDLAENEDVDYIDDYYDSTGINTMHCSIITGDGMDGLMEKLQNKISILVGNSGVGKSSILNALYPGLDLRTSAISNSTKKGRHTTTNVEMIKINNTGIIDTPGFREFGLMDIEPQMLGQYFNEFKEYIGGCNFRTCTHDHEPGCMVKKHVESNEIFYDRYISYLNIFYSLKEHYNNLY